MVKSWRFAANAGQPECPYAVLSPPIILETQKNIGRIRMANSWYRRVPMFSVGRIYYNAKAEGGTSQEIQWDGVTGSVYEMGKAGSASR